VRIINYADRWTSKVHFANQRLLVNNQRVVPLCHIGGLDKADNEWREDSAAVSCDRCSRIAQAARESVHAGIREFAQGYR
jgi:hypothetical protein